MTRLVDDRPLLEAFRRGEPAALAEVYREYAPQELAAGAATRKLDAWTTAWLGSAYGVSAISGRAPAGALYAGGVLQYAEQPAGTWDIYTIVDSSESRPPDIGARVGSGRGGACEAVMGHKL